MRDCAVVGFAQAPQVRRTDGTTNGVYPGWRSSSCTVLAGAEIISSFSGARRNCEDA